MKRIATFGSFLLAAGVAAILTLAVWSPATAGTTGGVSGRVTDADTHAPIAGARVVAVSVSGSASTSTDARGLYAFISLAPDTYVLTASKDGYQTFAQAGLTIQADTQQTLDVALVSTAKTLGKIMVSGTSAALVRPGQTINVYSIGPTAAQASQTLAGPGGVDQAYGSLATVPGLYVPQGQQGWYQPIFIRGGDQDQIGYELDGVPVNRSYDNAPQSLLSNVGQQELQVYTGGATASSDGQGISGYINQVVKRGALTPFGSVTYGVGAPTLYQKGGFEFGASSGGGRFTYYVAAAVSQQNFRYYDQSNGASMYGAGFFFPSFQFGPSGPIDLPGITLGASSTLDREVVANFHLALPHRADGGSDDLQLLHVESNLHTYTYGSFNDFGGVNTFGTTFAFPDQFVYTGPVGAPLDVSQVAQYLYPNTGGPGRAYQSTVDPNLRAVADNGFSLTKLQFQHNIGTHAYLRVLGFSTYSDWIISDPLPVPSTLQYILPEITFGGVVTFQDQLNEHHILSLGASLADSREFRYTTGFDFLLGGGFTSNGQIGGSFFGSVNIGSYTDGSHCYDQSSGAYASCFSSASQATLDINGGTFNPFTVGPAGSPAALNGARWIATENGYGGLINKVSPVLTAASVADRYHPNDRLTVDVGARIERYDDRLVNLGDGFPARQFWFNAWNAEFCVASANLALVQRSIDPGSGAASSCSPGSSPIGLQLANDATESNSVLEPRLAATFELSGDSVLRMSYGTYARPPNASWVQYGTLQQDLATPMATKFIQYGFTSPQHDLLPDVSHNFDLSWERRIPGTDMSFKVTPYYRGTMGQFENILLDTSGNESGVNVGSERSFGVELAFQKGDFSRDGVSGVFALTYDYSRFRYAKFASGFNVIDLNNHQIQQYNAYTSACATGGGAVGQMMFGSPLCGQTTVGLGAAACFAPGGAPDPSCASGDTPNPYWNLPAQALQDPGGAYTPYDVIPDQPLAGGNGFGPPVTATVLAQVRRGRFTATPSVTYSSGATYGTPLSTLGSDPAGGAFSIVIPDDYTGQFDKMGAFVQPWRLTGNISLGFQMTTVTKVTVSLANVFDSCHQRGYAWDRAGYCVYSTLPFGQAPNSSTFSSAPGDPNYAYPYSVLNGNNNTQFLGTKLPLQAYVSVQVKL